MVCRFCGGKDGDKSFKNEAHVFPQFIGNKKLLSHYECDSCNIFFSEGIENNFANYFLPFNNFFRIAGSRNVPTYISSENVRVESCSKTDTISVKLQNLTSNDFTHINENGEREFIYEMKPYIPMAVFKCFVKMALSVMPINELHQFENTINWLMNTKHEHFYSNGRRLLLKMALFKHHHFDTDIRYGICKKVIPSCNVPYMLFCIEWGQMHCMIEIPIGINMHCIEIENMPLLVPNEIETHPVEHTDLTSASEK